MNTPEPASTPTPYLIGAILTERQLQLIAEHILSAERISSAWRNDYAWAINEFFHDSCFHQVVIPRQTKAFEKDTTVYLYSHSVIPSFNGQTPNPHPDECRRLLRGLVKCVPVEVRKEFLGVRMAVTTWPKYWAAIYEDMIEWIRRLRENSSDGIPPESPTEL
ncbi:hypothetical protein BT96DRAFT_949564 [Gymnopus androsaceus JB14]|uniref:Uncharacterized protein n=1 Tax=Gymnopus androsaceus JB14 TaxID=1447944 RepID=A0A6A4GK94_9AGAR|nr:hypothetical protein BT96DRAFT_949564 [Gymnopus androsaceus JB14]